MTGLLRPVTGSGSPGKPIITNSPDRNRSAAGRLQRNENSRSVQWVTAVTSVASGTVAGIVAGVATGAATGAATVSAVAAFGVAAIWFMGILSAGGRGRGSVGKARRQPRRRAW